MSRRSDIISYRVRLHRVCECAVSVCYESDWGLHCTFCRPRYVRIRQCSLIGRELIMDRPSFFQWHDILQVIIPRTSAMAAASSKGESVSQEEGFTTCPICLAPPTAPRMTKCGHVRTRTLGHAHILTIDVGVLLSMYPSPSWDCGEQVGSLPCVFRLRERETPKSR
jgi:hypothetical protein